MSSKIIINNQTKQVTIDGVAVNSSTALPAATEQGSILVSDASGAYVSYTSPTFMRNRIINGDMRIAQRGTAAITTSSLPVDRWNASKVSSGTFSAQQQSDAPSGFSNSIYWLVTGAGSPSSSQYNIIQQRIEGTQIIDFGLGMSSAKSVTLSFWVKSSVTGTYCVSVRNGSQNRSYVCEYTVNAQNTWERKIVTIPGDQSGIWAIDSSVGIYLTWSLSCGSSFVTTANSWQSGNYLKTSSEIDFSNVASATFYLTGVQLEVGSVATAFEYRPIQYELALCQRYYARLKSNGTELFVPYGAGVCQSTTAATLYFPFPQIMRTSPTLTQSNTCVTTNVTTTRFATTGISGYYCADNSAVVYTTHTGLTAQAAVVWCANNDAAAYVELNAEL